jgi:DNA-binding response OmpR family regulator
MRPTLSALFLNRASVLVADPDPVTAGAMATEIRRHGLSPYLATRGREALSVAAAFRPLMAVVDAALPDMPGLEVVRHLKALDPDLPVAMTTATADGGLEVEARALGLAYYGTKPLSQHHLAAVLARTLSRERERLGHGC